MYALESWVQDQMSGETSVPFDPNNDDVMLLKCESIDTRVLVLREYRLMMSSFSKLF